LTHHVNVQHFYVGEKIESEVVDHGIGATLKLPGKQEELISTAMAAAPSKPVVVILFTTSPKNGEAFNFMVPAAAACVRACVCVCVACSVAASVGAQPRVLDRAAIVAVVVVTLDRTVDGGG